MHWLVVFVAISLAGISSTSAAVCRDFNPAYCKRQAPYCKTSSIVARVCPKTCGLCGGPTKFPPTTIPPFTGKCGQPMVKGIRIISGKTARRGSWPWQVLMSYNGRPTCGGTLISPEWVVTAAHCVDGRDKHPTLYTIRVGEHDRDQAEGSEVNIVASKVLKNQQFTAKMDNDIALIKLSKPVKYNKYVSPACLPTRDPDVGSTCYITGWGKTRYPGMMSGVLQQASMQVVSNEVCYKKNRQRVSLKVTPGMMCAGDGGKTRLSGCHGDSGGPFVCLINGVWELQGQVSYGSPSCKSSDMYTVFSRTNYYRGWIERTMKEN